MAYEHRSMSEVEFAYKYFDWKFYLARSNYSLETMSKMDILMVLSNKPYSFKEKTLDEIMKEYWKKHYRANEY